jgi:hypothetical protein
MDAKVLLDGRPLKWFDAGPAQRVPAAEQRDVGGSRPSITFAIMPIRKVPIIQRTSTAEIILVEPGWIEQRFQDDAQFSPEAVHENQMAIDVLAGDAPYVQMNVFPAGMRVNLPLMDKDHFREKRECNQLRAMAVVTDSEEMHTASKLYFLYHQQPFKTRVFEDEQDARSWLHEHAR